MLRRSFLHAFVLAGVSALAGCANALSNHDPRANDLTIRNTRNESVPFDLIVALPDGETVSSS